MMIAVFFTKHESDFRSGVAKVLLREPEVARGRFYECKGKECKDGTVFSLNDRLQGWNYFCGCDSNSVPEMVVGNFLS